MRQTFIESLMFIHICAGLGCIAAGPAAMLIRPKGGVLHRRYGLWYVRLMALLASTAAVLLVFRWNPFFFSLSALSFYLCFSAWRVLLRKRAHILPPEPFQRAQGIDWAAAGATIAVGIASVFLWRGGYFGDQADQAAIVLGTLAFAVIIAAFDLWRFLYPAALSRYPAAWLIEHLAKMGGSYIAVASAFSGTVLQQFLPITFAQTWPAIVGVPIILWVSFRYWLPMRRRATKAAES
jgi:hypothetical protein